MKMLLRWLLVLLAVVLGGCASCCGQETPEWEPLFAKEGVPAGWVVRCWDNVALAPVQPIAWTVRAGVLHGGEPRGSWLLSEREYGDFELEFEWRLGAKGNSGCGLRVPLRGDPAFDGLELQMADLRYNPTATPAELTGGIYRALAPSSQRYRPEEWNRYQVSLKGARLSVVLNGEKIQDADLAAEAGEVTRHDGSAAPALKDRPLRGHIGFQELSRDGGVEIRHARIRVLSQP